MPGLPEMWPRMGCGACGLLRKLLYARREVSGKPSKKMQPQPKERKSSRVTYKRNEPKYPLAEPNIGIRVASPKYAIF